MHLKTWRHGDSHIANVAESNAAKGETLELELAIGVQDASDGMSGTRTSTTLAPWEKTCAASSRDCPGSGAPACVRRGTATAPACVRKGTTTAIVIALDVGRVRAEENRAASGLSGLCNPAACAGGRLEGLNLHPDDAALVFLLVADLRDDGA